MTYREKLQQEHPGSVGDYVGGCECCPSDWGYEEKCCFHDPGTRLERMCKCTECWERDLPEEEPHG